MTFQDPETKSSMRRDQHHHHTEACTEACCDRPAKVAKASGLGDQDSPLTHVVSPQGDESCLSCVTLTEAVLALKRPEVASCILPPSSEDAELATLWKERIGTFPLFKLETTVKVRHGTDIRSALRKSLVPMLPAELKDPHGDDGEIMRATLGRLERLVRDVMTASLGAAVNGSKVRVRVESVDGVMCPKFHQDNVPLRACVTMAGETTDVLPESAVDREVIDAVDDGVTKPLPLEEYNDKVACGQAAEEVVLKPPLAGTLLMKGLKWTNAERKRPSAAVRHLAAVHRSPPDCGRRLLLAADVGSEA